MSFYNSYVSIARADMAAFETQGRFIQSRYKDEALGD